MSPSSQNCCSLFYWMFVLFCKDGWTQPHGGSWQCLIRRVSSRSQLTAQALHEQLQSPTGKTTNTVPLYAWTDSATRLLFYEWQTTNIHKWTINEHLNAVYTMSLYIFLITGTYESLVHVCIFHHLAGVCQQRWQLWQKRQSKSERGKGEKGFEIEQEIMYFN